MGASAASHALLLVLAVPLAAGDAAAQEQVRWVHASRTSIFFGPHIGYEVSPRMAIDYGSPGHLSGDGTQLYVDSAHAGDVGAEMGFRFFEHYAVLARYEHASFARLGDLWGGGADVSSDTGELGVAYFSHPDGFGWYGEFAVGVRFFDSTAWGFKGVPTVEDSRQGTQLSFSFGPNIRISGLNVTPTLCAGLAAVVHRQWDAAASPQWPGSLLVMPPPADPSYGFLEFRLSLRADIGLR